MAVVNALDASGELERQYQDDKDNLVDKFDDVSGWEDAGDGETTIIDTIFAVQSRVSYELFLEQMITKATWVFNPTKLRERLWKEAGVENKHMKEWPKVCYSSSKNLTNQDKLITSQTYIVALTSFVSSFIISVHIFWLISNVFSN